MDITQAPALHTAAPNRMQRLAEYSQRHHWTRDSTAVFAPRFGLRLLDVRRFDGSDNVLLRHAAPRA